MALNRATTIALAICLSAAACTRAPTPTASREEPQCLRGVEIPGGRTGVIYAAAGEDPYNAELYEIRLGRNICGRRLTEGARISELTAGNGMLITSNARGIIGDRIELFRDGRFQPVPWLGRPYAFGPELSPDGRWLAFIRAWGPQNRVKAVVAMSLLDGRKIRLYVTRSRRELPGGLAWGPRQQVAFPLGSRRQQDLLVARLGAEAQVVDHQDIWAPTAEWYPGRLIALGAPIMVREGNTLLITPSGREVGRISGWSPVAWSPDGAVLLVQQRDGTLGVTAPPDWRVTRLGRPPFGPIYDRSMWLEAPIPDVVPQHVAGPTTTPA